MSGRWSHRSRGRGKPAKREEAQTSMVFETVNSLLKLGQRVRIKEDEQRRVIMGFIVVVILQCIQISKH